MDEKELINRIEKRFKETHPDKTVAYASQVEQDLKRLFSRNPVYVVPRWTRNAVREIRMAWQRVFRGWSDDSLWDLYTSHAEEMRDKLRALARRAHGCPGRLCLGEGYHRCGETADSPDDEQLKKKAGQKCEWKEVLNDIADGFQAELDIADHKYMDGTNDEELWKQRRLLLEARAARGWDLFREYYRDMWD